MSREIGPYQYQTGVTDLKGVLRNAAGQVRNVSGASIDTFETWADGSIDDYDFVLTEDGTSGDFYADLPAGLSTSVTYHVTPFRGTATLANYRNTKEPGCLVGPGNDDVAALVWAYATRTLTSVSAVVTDVASSVWSYATRTLTGPVRIVETLQHGEWSIVKGDSRLNADGTAQAFTKETGSITWPATLVSGSFSVKLEIEPSVELLAETPAALDLQVSGTVVDATNVRFDITAAQSATLSAGVYVYNVVAFKSGVQYTLESGTVVVEDNVDA